MTLTGAPSQRSAALAAIGAADQRVATGAGDGTSARARPPSRRTVATPSTLAQVSSTLSTRADARSGRRAEVAGGRIVGPGHRHDPIDEDAALLQRRRARPASQALSTAATQVGWPATASGATARWTRLRVLEQRFLEHADQRRAQARRRRLRQGDAMPADVGLLDDGDHDRAARQQRRRGLALRVDLDAVVAGDVDVLAPARARRRRLRSATPARRRRCSGSWRTRVDMAEAAKASAILGTCERASPWQSRT